MRHSCSPAISRRKRLGDTKKFVSFALLAFVLPLTAVCASVAPTAPVISPVSSKYYAAQIISMSDSTPGATIYYTTDGSAPTTSSKRYSGPFSISTSQNIQAIAVTSAGTVSKAAKSWYVIQLTAATPVISPAPGTYSTAQSIKITDSTPGAVVYYTVNGRYPNSSSSVYSGPIPVSGNVTIQAIAVAPTYWASNAAQAQYTVVTPAAAPSISPAGGKYTSAQTVKLSDSTPGASIYYTTDGTVPTAASQLYTGPITVPYSQTVQAIAMVKGGLASGTVKAVYSLPTSAPVISVASGTYNSIQTVTISDATPGAVIYYTINGRYPNTSAPVYSAPITATTNTLIQAIAVAPGSTPSAEAIAQYSIVAPPPVISPGAGTFNYKTSVNMVDAAPGAVIHYTTDGSIPSSSSPVYSGPIVLSPQRTTTTQFKAIAIANGYIQSSVTSGAVTVTLPDQVLAHAIVSPTPQMTIPPDFMGLSSDWTQPAAMMGKSSTGVNTAYRRLLKNLTQYYSAPLLFRIEGDNSTVSALQADVQPLIELAQDINVRYTLGVDLMTDNIATTQAEAALWASSMPNNLIAALEIGNEPDNYPWQGVRPITYDSNQYLSEFQQWQQAVLSATGNQFPVMGPSTSGSSWNLAVENALASGGISAGLVSQHAYLTGAAPGQTLPADYLLQPSAVTKLPQGYAPFAAAAHQVGTKFRMGEINSVGGGGALGISNTFQSTLWSIDIMFNYLANGVDGVNWHSGQYTNYALFQFKPQPSKSGKTVFNLVQVNPLYYGLWAFAQVAGRGAQLLPVQTMSDANVSVWATVDNTSTAHVVAINKDEQASGALQIVLPGYSSASVRYLTAPSFSSTSGVTFGGQTFDGSTDGNPLGQAQSTVLFPENGVFTLPNLPSTTAAVIDFTN